MAHGLKDTLINISIIVSFILSFASAVRAKLVDLISHAFHKILLIPNLIFQVYLLRETADTSLPFVVFIGKFLNFNYGKNSANLTKATLYGMPSCSSFHFQ